MPKDPKPTPYWHTHFWNRCSAVFVLPGWENEKKIRCDRWKNHVDGHATMKDSGISRWTNTWVS